MAPYRPWRTALIELTPAGLIEFYYFFLVFLSLLEEKLIFPIAVCPIIHNNWKLSLTVTADSAYQKKKASKVAHTWSSRKALNSSQIPSSKYVYLLYLIGNIRSNGQQLNFRFSSWIHHYICWNINYNAFEQTALVKKGCADKFRVPLSSSFVQIKKARETRTQ